MAPAASIHKQQLSSYSGLKVEDIYFPSTVKPPGSNKTLSLGGAGVRGLHIKDKFIKFTSIGVYVDENEAIPSLSIKWKGKSADELTDSIDFFVDIVTGPFEKFTRITMILPLTGVQYSEKVMENSVAIMEARKVYTEVEAKAVDKFMEIFKDQNFPPGASVLFTQSHPLGTLTIGFSKDDSIPEVGNAIIENKPLAEAILESIIGKNGVSPATKRSLADRISELMLEEETGGEVINIEDIAKV